MRMAPVTAEHLGVIAVKATQSRPFSSIPPVPLGILKAAQNSFSSLLQARNGLRMRLCYSSHREEQKKRHGQNISYHIIILLLFDGPYGMVLFENQCKDNHLLMDNCELFKKNIL